MAALVTYRDVTVGELVEWVGRGAFEGAVIEASHIFAISALMQINYHAGGQYGHFHGYPVVCNDDLPADAPARIGSADKWHPFERSAV